MLVSVMMPAYNAGKYIGDAIESMWKQTYKNWELIIVDDGSEDDTFEVALDYARKDERIVFITDDHHGCPTTRNTCIRHASGDIIARLDADDTHDPHRLEAQVKYLYNHDVDIVTCGMTWIKDGLKMRVPTNAMDVRGYMSGRVNGPCCASIVTWASVYHEVGEFNEEMLAGSDGDWNFRAIVKGKTWGHISQDWYNQRRHSGQISQTLRKEQRLTHETSRRKYARIWKLVSP